MGSFPRAPPRPRAPAFNEFLSSAAAVRFHNCVARFDPENHLVQLKAFVHPIAFQLGSLTITW